ncbi:A24 family peptidase [Piscinibacter sp. XHJ-5]|uniref:prepilin peptidase n=1 Tax=Piscinibacter sp. XHJ-5 TaxID=3037797 RepID=UPI00245332D1|nr:A24 family peptidase [Piscinibacter sp. XHJ-5]
MTPEFSQVLLSPWLLGLLGLCIGSFLNVVIHRLPQMLERGWKLDSAEMLGVKVEVPPRLTLSKPRSRCPSCGHGIAWHENIPVLSWLRLGGKCSACKAPISPRYPSVEILTGALFAATAWRFGAQPTTVLWCGFVGTLVALAGIDWDTTLLPDNVTLPLLWAGLVAAALGWTIPLSSSLWGAVGGYLSLWTVYWIFKHATGKEGMGYGDFKLLSALGAWLGVQMLLPVVLGASLLGAVVGIGMKLTGALREGRYVPFGPFLAGAGVVVMLAGPQRVLGWLGWA